MKIEKINDNQIRCTLNKADLAARHLKISELAYGSDKAKALFRDMMQQASAELGFDAEDIPLMIEAIPVSAECIVLIVTKVDDPEELDTRFSKFTPFKDRGQGDPVSLDGADNIIDLFQKLCESKLKTLSKKNSAEDKKSAEEKPEQETPAVNVIRLFVFSRLDDVIAAAHGLNGFFTGQNTLYRNTENETYLLVLHQSETSPEDFNRVCNILSEYGSSKAFTVSGEAYLKEHGKLVSANALQQLVQL